MSSRNWSVLAGLIVGQICLHASMAGLRMSAPLRLLETGHGKGSVGPLLALFSVGPILMAMPAGRLADRLGYHVPVRLAVGLTVAGGLLALASSYMVSGQYPLLCAAALLSGAGGNLGLITIQRSAGRNARDPDELKRIFSWLGVAPSLSNFVGPLGSGLLIDNVGFQAAFGMLAVIPLLSLSCAPLVPREAPLPQTEAPERRAAWDLLSTASMRRLLLVNWFTAASWDVHSFLVPILGHERGLSASAIGTVLGIFAVSVTTVRLFIPLLAHRLDEAQVLGAALAVIAAVFVAYPWATSVTGMALCASVLGLALGASQPMVMTALHRLTPVRRHGEAIALRSLALNTSSALMPLGFGVIGMLLGASGLFWLMAAVVGTGAFFARSLDLEG